MARKLFHFERVFEHSVDSILCCTGFRNVTPSGNTCANLFGGTSSGISTVHTAVTYIQTESQVSVLIVLMERFKIERFQIFLNHIKWPICYGTYGPYHNLYRFWPKSYDLIAFITGIPFLLSKLNSLWEFSVHFQKLTTKSVFMKVSYK